MVHWLLQVFEGDNEAQEVGQILKHWGGFREVCGQANDFTLHCESNENWKQDLEQSITKRDQSAQKTNKTVRWERFEENRTFWTDCGVTVFIYARRLKRMLCFFVLLSKAVCRYLGVSHLFQVTNWWLFCKWFRWFFFFSLSLGFQWVLSCQRADVCVHVMLRFDLGKTWTNSGHAAFQRFASTDVKHYVFCVTDTKNE